MKNKTWLRLIYIIALLTFSTAQVSADEAGGATTEAAPSEARSAYMARLQELMELKEKDPEAFRTKIVALRNDAQKRLDGLKESDPQTYERVLRRRQQRIEPKFERMQEERPEAYERVREHRQGLIEKRVAWFEKNDPEKFKEIELRREMRARAIHPTQRVVGPGIPHKRKNSNPNSTVDQQLGPKLQDWHGRTGDAGWMARPSTRPGSRQKLGQAHESGSDVMGRPDTDPQSRRPQIIRRGMKRGDPLGRRSGG